MLKLPVQSWGDWAPSHSPSCLQILVQVKEILSKLSTLVETTLKEVRGQNMTPCP